MASLLNTQMPAPDAIVHYPKTGEFLPAMLFYASEGCNPKHIAMANGFDVRFVKASDIIGEDDPLAKALEDCQDIIARWEPPSIDGWKLVGKTNSEDGPVAMYLRKAVRSDDPLAEMAAEANRLDLD